MFEELPPSKGTLERSEEPRNASDQHSNLEFEETLLKREFKPYTQFLTVEDLFSSEEWSWLNTSQEKRDSDYYSSPIKDEVAGKLAAIHELHSSLGEFQKTNLNSSINQYHRWLGVQQQKLHSHLASMILPRGAHALQSLDKQTLSAYLRVFQCINRRTRDESIKHIVESAIETVDDAKEGTLNDIVSYVKTKKVVEIEEDDIKIEISKQIGLEREDLDRAGFRVIAAGANEMVIIQVRVPATKLAPESIRHTAIDRGGDIDNVPDALVKKILTFKKDESAE